MNTLNKLEEILIANNLLLRKENKFVLNKNTKITAREFDRFVKENPRLLEPGIIAIDLNKIVKDEKNLKKEYLNYIKVLRDTVEDNDFGKVNFNIQQLKLLHEAHREYLEEVNLAPKITIRKTSLDNFLKNKKNENFLILEELLFNAIFYAVKENNTEILRKFFRVFIKYKVVVRVDLIKKELEKGNDLVNKFILVLLNKMDKRRFAPIIHKYTKKTIKNRVFQIGDINKICNNDFLNYGIIVDDNFFNFDNYDPVIKDTILLNRLIIGANARADFFTHRTYYEAKLKDLPQIIFSNKSSVIDYQKSFSLYKLNK